MPDNPNFEEVFGFREPTQEEVDSAADDMSFKFQNEGQPIGTAALFGVEGAQDVAMEYLTKMGEQLAEDYDIDSKVARTILYFGFIGAVELLAAIRLRVDE